MTRQERKVILDRADRFLLEAIERIQFPGTVSSVTEKLFAAADDFERLLCVTCGSEKTQLHLKGFEIVGVIKHLKRDGLTSQTKAMVYGLKGLDYLGSKLKQTYDSCEESSASNMGGQINNGFDFERESSGSSKGNFTGSIPPIDCNDTGLTTNGNGNSMSTFNGSSQGTGHKTDYSGRELDMAELPHLSQYKGQNDAIRLFVAEVSSAKKNDRSPEHVRIIGRYGLGKSLLAELTAREFGKTRENGGFIERDGETLTKKMLEDDLKNIKEGDILLIDEIHCLNKDVKNMLLLAVLPNGERGKLTYREGPKGKETTKTKTLPLFCCIGGTTNEGELCDALLSRLSCKVPLEPYKPEFLAGIIIDFAKSIHVEFPYDLALSLAKRSRGVPRDAKTFTREVCRSVSNRGFEKITEAFLEEYYQTKPLDAKGLLADDIGLLTKMIKQYGGGPVGQKIMATLVGARGDIKSVERIEPYLREIHFIKLTPRGRVVTDKAYLHLGITPNGGDSPPPPSNGVDESTGSGSQADEAPLDTPIAVETGADSSSEEKNTSKKRRGEEAVAAALAEKLDPNSYEIFNNVIFPYGKHTVEVDHIVVSPYGVFVIETKDYSGRVEGHQHTEYFFQHKNGKKNPFYNPIKQNKGHILKLAEIIGDYPYIGAVVFTDRSELNVKTTSFVGHINDLIEHIKSITDETVSKDCIAAIVEKIMSLRIEGEEAEQQHIQNVREIRDQKKEGKNEQEGETTKSSIVPTKQTVLEFLTTKPPRQPVSKEEIANELGASVAVVEDVLKELIAGSLIKLKIDGVFATLQGYEEIGKEYKPFGG